MVPVNVGEAVGALALNVCQSVLDNFPVWVASATGILNVWVEVDDEILKSVPVVPVANVCVVAVRVFRVVIPLPAPPDALIVNPLSVEVMVTLVPANNERR